MPCRVARQTAHWLGCGMPKRLKDADGLTPQEGRYAAYLCQGMTQVDAFKKTWPKTRATQASIHERASRLANKPAIKARCQELLQSMKISDLDSQARAYSNLLGMI